MLSRFVPVVRIALTLLVVGVALLAGREVWQRYEVDPWTRDGKVRADVVRVAADVPGLVTSVLVKENQRVAKGDALFVIDAPRYRLALSQAQASVASARASLSQAESELRRDITLGDLVAAEELEQARTRAVTAATALASAQTNVKVAQLNLDRTVVRATVNGRAANLQLKPGDYVTAGSQAMALVDEESVWVEGYFEETKLPRIHVGDPARIILMGESTVLRGKVESIAPGIDDRDRSTGGNQLASINPTFNWVRLAQRVPVRIALRDVPADIALISGRTATVTIDPLARQQQGTSQ